MSSGTYDSSEQDELLNEFLAQLRMATGDGGKKREAGLKPPWYEDDSHLSAVFSHLRKYFQGEKVDPDSGAHPLTHAAWRLLAIACSEIRKEQERELEEFHVLSAEDCMICDLDYDDPALD